MFRKTCPELAKYFHRQEQPTRHRQQRTATPSAPPGIDSTRTARQIEHCLDELHRRQIDLTATYADWVEIGFAFASMGEDGRGYFHQVSEMHPKYEPMECERKFTELLRSANGRVNIGTFFHRCQQEGIELI